MAKTENAPKVRAVATLEQIVAARAAIDTVKLDPRLREYIVSLVHATREPASVGLKELVGRIRYGASPRATIWLALTSRANAFLDGRDFVTPADIKRIAPDVLRHRVVLNFEAEAEGRTADEVVQNVIDTLVLDAK